MKKEHIQVVPSILSCDFANLQKEIERVEKAGADALHLDIMDGHFVPNLTFGPSIVAAIKRSTSLFLDVHLMIYNPFEYVERFIESGADRITFHFEATEDVEDTLKFIKKCNLQAGLAFSPGTSCDFIPRYLPLCDMILLMTVEPGFSGQVFIKEVLEKIRFARDFCNGEKIFSQREDLKQQKKTSFVPFPIQVDGGINQETAKACIQAGANVLVSGTHLMQAKDMAKEIDLIKNL